MIFNRIQIRRWIACLMFVLSMSVSIFADSWYTLYNANNPQVEVEGVRYMLEYYKSLNKDENTQTQDYYLETYTKRLREYTNCICKGYEFSPADGDYPRHTFFYFNDGSKIPAFDCVTTVLANNAKWRKPIDTPSVLIGDEKLGNRYKYYRGHVWIEDSVPMPDLPNFRKTKYHIVCDMQPGIFNEELKSIRTPRYCVLNKGQFKDCTGLRTAQIGAAHLVASNAFENCTSLETVFFESLPIVEDNAFTNCQNIKYVVIDGHLPQNKYIYEYERNPFDNEVYENATLYVHAEQLQEFKEHETWGKFKNIHDIEEYISGVDKINPDAEEKLQIYNLSGVLVGTATAGQDWRENLPSGVYIVKSSLGKVKKEYIK